LLAIDDRGVRHQRGPDSMWPERSDNSEMTLRRFCRWRQIPLDDAQRSVIGIELSKRATQRQIPLGRVEERLDNGLRIRSRVYPRGFLEECLTKGGSRGVYSQRPKGVRNAIVTRSRIDDRWELTPLDRDQRRDQQRKRPHSLFSITRNNAKLTFAGS
jgi:hypothetical protein